MTKLITHLGDKENKYEGPESVKPGTMTLPRLPEPSDTTGDYDFAETAGTLKHVANRPGRLAYDILVDISLQRRGAQFPNDKIKTPNQEEANGLYIIRALSMDMPKTCTKSNHTSQPNNKQATATRQCYFFLYYMFNYFMLFWYIFYIVCIILQPLARHVQGYFP